MCSYRGNWLLAAALTFLEHEQSDQMQIVGALDGPR